MTLTKYKGYTIRTVGLSQYIYRPNRGCTGYSDYYEQSMAAAKRWINEDIKNTQGES